MIRFSCDSCGRALRAPASMAGKRGKCARCGGVNKVPEILSVDVKRAPEASPFRDADTPTRGAIVEAVEVGGAFLAAPVEGPVARREGAGAYEQVTGQLVDEETDPRAVRADFAASAAHASVPPHPMDGLGPSAPDYEFQLDRSHEMSRAIAAALVVGAVVGFCAGLLASKWIL
jgi:hypothetical protein